MPGAHKTRARDSDPSTAARCHDPGTPQPQRPPKRHETGRLPRGPPPSPLAPLTPPAPLTLHGLAAVQRDLALALRAVRLHSDELAAGDGTVKFPLRAPGRRRGGRGRRRAGAGRGAGAAGPAGAVDEHVGDGRDAGGQRAREAGARGLHGARPGPAAGLTAAAAAAPTARPPPARPPGARPGAAPWAAPPRPARSRQRTSRARSGLGGRGAALPGAPGSLHATAAPRPASSASSSLCGRRRPARPGAAVPPADRPHAGGCKGTARARRWAHGGRRAELPGRSWRRAGTEASGSREGQAGRRGPASSHPDHQHALGAPILLPLDPSPLVLGTCPWAHAPSMLTTVSIPLLGLRYRVRGLDLPFCPKACLGSLVPRQAKFTCSANDQLSGT